MLRARITDSTAVTQASRLPGAPLWIIGHWPLVFVDALARFIVRREVKGRCLRRMRDNAVFRSSRLYAPVRHECNNASSPICRLTP